MSFYSIESLVTAAGERFPLKSVPKPYPGSALLESRVYNESSMVALLTAQSNGVVIDRMNWSDDANALIVAIRGLNKFVQLKADGESLLPGNNICGGVGLGPAPEETSFDATQLFYDRLFGAGPVFTLSNIVSKPHLASLYINGQKQVYGVDYTINGTQLTWQGYPLDDSWVVDIYYS